MGKKSKRSKKSKDSKSTVVVSGSGLRVTLPKPQFDPLNPDSEKMLGALFSTVSMLRALNVITVTPDILKVYFSMLNDANNQLFAQVYEKLVDKKEQLNNKWIPSYASKKEVMEKVVELFDEFKKNTEKTIQDTVKLLGDIKAEAKNTHISEARAAISFNEAGDISFRRHKTLSLSLVSLFNQAKEAVRLTQKREEKEFESELFYAKGGRKNSGVYTLYGLCAEQDKTYLSLLGNPQKILKEKVNACFKKDKAVVTDVDVRELKKTVDLLIILSINNPRAEGVLKGFQQAILKKWGKEVVSVSASSDTLFPSKPSVKTLVPTTSSSSSVVDSKRPGK